MGWEPADFEVVANVEGFDGIFGREDWKAMLTGCVIGSDMRDALELPGEFFFLFTGPHGVGKTALARAFAGEVGYRLFSFKLEKLLGEGPEKVREDLSVLCRQLAGGGPSFLLIEDVDSERADEAAGLLSQSLVDLGKRGSSLICVMTAQNEEAVPYPLREISVACRLGEPMRDERAACFKGMLGGIAKCRGGFSWEQMADETEGFSFTDCKVVSLFIKGLLVEKGMRTYNDMTTLREALKSGALRLTPEMFSKAAAMAHPRRENRDLPAGNLSAASFAKRGGAGIAPQAGPSFARQMAEPFFAGQAGAESAPQARPSLAGSSMGSPVGGHPAAGIGERPNEGGRQAGNLNYDEILIDDIFAANSEMNPDNL